MLQAADTTQSRVCATKAFSGMESIAAHAEHAHQTLTLLERANMAVLRIQFNAIAMKDTMAMAPPAGDAQSLFMACGTTVCNSE